MYICQLKNQIMLLTIDIGNTRIKCAVFEQNRLLEKFIFTKKEALIFFKNIFKKYDAIKDSISSSVGKLDETCFRYLSDQSNLLIVSHKLNFPFVTLYSTPLTLGIDRMVLTSGASLLYPTKNCLVIDAGTCITYDFKDNQNNYLGGAISPGLQLRYSSLHNYTAKLPLLEQSFPENYIGNSTEQSIHSGIVNGVIHEMEGFISQYLLKNKDLTIILTGGDAEFLAKRLKSTIFANSNFLLEICLKFIVKHLTIKADHYSSVITRNF